MRQKREDYLFTQIQELDEYGQTYLIEKILSIANREKLKQRRDDVGATVTAQELGPEAKLVRDNWGTPLGFMSDYDTLNLFAGGFRRKGVYIIGGSASSGKSTFAINLATQFDQQNKKVHIVSYEDTSTFVTARVSIILDGLEQTGITFPANDLIEGIYSMDHNKLYEHLSAVKKKSGLDVVVIDYIQFMALFSEELEYIAINNTMKLFRDIAKTLDIVLIGLSQLNRNKEVSTKSFHGSSAIEKLADVAIIIQKDVDQGSISAQVVKSKFTRLREKSIIRFDYEIGKEGAKLNEIGENIQNDV